MTISQIEALLTLASTLNYTKASAILHTTQPNLSRIIVNLEKEVGVQLLHRNKRDVKLTPAGKRFCREMEGLVYQYRHAIDAAREVESGIDGSIDVGILGTALVRQLPAIVGKFRQRHPNISLHLVDYTYSRLMEALAEEKVDMALIPDRELDRLPNLSKKFLFADDMCLVVKKDHPYAGAESIDLSSLRGEQFILMDKVISYADYELVTGICVEQDFIPQVAYEANTLNNLILMIECGLGVSILARHMSHYATENVAFVGLKGYEKYFRVSCAWNRDSNPCIPQLLDVIDSCIG